MLKSTPTLLVITDRPAVRLWAKKHLDEQYFVIYAEKKHEAIDALYSRPDIVILDESLESCDPLKLSTELNQVTQKNFIPIFLITGKLKKSFRQKARQSGVTDFLSDQLDIEEFQARIAAGEKSAVARDKMAGLGKAMQLPKEPSTAPSLKNKLVLNDEALSLLAKAKRENIPIALLFFQVDNLGKTQEPLAILTALIRKALLQEYVLIPSTEGRLILLLANATADLARVIAQKLHEKIPKEIKVSIVVSPLEASEKGFNQMIDSAVKAFRTRSETNFILSIDLGKP